MWLTRENSLTFLIVWSCGHSVIAFTFSGSAETPSDETANPRKIILSIQKAHFLDLHKTSQSGVCGGLALDGLRVASEFGCKSVYH